MHILHMHNLVAFFCCCVVCVCLVNSQHNISAATDNQTWGRVNELKKRKNWAPRNEFKNGTTISKMKIVRKQFCEKRNGVTYKASAIRMFICSFISSALCVCAFESMCRSLVQNAIYANAKVYAKLRACVGMCFILSIMCLWVRVTPGFFQFSQFCFNSCILSPYLSVFHSHSH